MRRNGYGGNKPRARNRRVHINDPTTRSQNPGKLYENGWLCRKCNRLSPALAETDVIGSTHGAGETTEHERDLFYWKTMELVQEMNATVHHIRMDSDRH